MNPFVSLLLNLAHALAPKNDKLWIGDMQLEAPFVPNKLRFAFAALALAFKFRFAAMKTRPVGIAFATAALAAVASIFVIPNVFRGNDTTQAAMTPVPNASYEEVQDVAEERGYVAEAQVGTVDSASSVQAQTNSTVPPAETEAPEDTVAQAVDNVEEVARVAPEAEAESSNADAAVANVPAAETLEPATPEPLAAIPAPEEIQTPVAPELATPAITPNATAETTPATEEMSAGETLGLGSGTFADTTTTEATLGQDTITGIPAPATPAVDTEVISTQIKGESVTIEVVADTLLTLYRDTNFSGSPRTHGYVKSGETFTANVPFSLHTNNAAAIKITADGESYSLGEEGEEQFRIFSKP